MAVSKESDHRNMKKYDTKQFEQDLESFSIFLSPKQIEQFLIYYEMLAEWNQVMNLTAITEYEEVMKKHFVDSLSLVKAYNMAGNKKLIDVGTGAGFPGIPLKIVYPDINVTLLDSLQKRVGFLNAVIEKLEISGIEAVHGRAEDLARDKRRREQYDLSVSRAVANLTTLSEYCLPFVKVGGCFISYKSEKAEEEVTLAGHAISLLGGSIEKQVPLQLPSSDLYRNLIVIKKQTATPGKYPRKAGLPAKEPLQ